MSVEYPPEINADAPREPSETEVRVVHRAEVFKRAAFISFAILVLYLAVVASIGVTLIRSTQVSNHVLLDTINDCTNKNGKCHAQGVKSTAEAVASIAQRGTAQAACQIVLERRQPDTGTARELYKAIDKCATQTLALLARQRAAR